VVRGCRVLTRTQPRQAFIWRAVEPLFEEPSGTGVCIIIEDHRAWDEVSGFPNI
jgi:hypothetical protein